MSILLCFFLSYLDLAAASNYPGQEKASECMVVVGKVFCETCLEHRLSEKGYVISCNISYHFDILILLISYNIQKMANILIIHGSFLSLMNKQVLP